MGIFTSALFGVSLARSFIYFYYFGWLLDWDAIIGF